MLYENLRELDAVAKDEDLRKWHEQQLYIQNLEQRYPQVCTDCRPKARAAIKRANYFTRTWNMMISMRKTKTGEYAPVIQGRWWRSALLQSGHLGREASVVGQAVWHLLGARMAVMNATEPALGAEQPANGASIIAKAISCSTQLVTTNGVNPHCFADFTPWMFWLLVGGLLTIWWNNRLWQKYLDRKPGRMTGTRDYYLLQSVSLAIRSVAWYALQSPSLLASSSGLEHLSNINNIYRGAHICMIAFIGFVELISRAVVRLDNRYQVRVMRDEDILPDTPLQAKVEAGNAASSHRQAGSNPPAWLRQQPKAFDVSSLSNSLNARSTHPDPAPSFPQPQFNAPAAPPTPPLDDSMEWSPTEQSFAKSAFQSRGAQKPTYNLRPRNTPQKQRQAGPSPFSQLPPQAPVARMAHPRAPVQQSSFHSQTSLRANKQPWEAQPSDTPARPASQNGAWSNQRTDFSMAQPSFFLERDRVDTGLEGIFNDVFTLDDDTPVAPRQQQTPPLHQRGISMQRQLSDEDSPSRGHGGMFGQQWEEPEQSGATPSKSMDIGVLLVMAVPILILGIVVGIVKGWVDVKSLTGLVKGQNTTRANTLE